MPQKSQSDFQNNSVETTAANLMALNWDLPRFSVTEDHEFEFCSYAKDLERRDSCSLSEAENAYEWSRWIRSQAMFRHLEQFRNLMELCSDFVDALTKTGKQSILGTRAGLQRATLHERASRTIEFKPEAVPDLPPLGCSEYETVVGGSHVFGARILWWCAAALAPRKFGYASGFSRTVWTQPFWFVDNFESRRRELRVNRRPIELLQEAAMYVFKNMDSSECVEFEDPSPSNGVEPGGAFNWEGKKVQLQPRQARLVAELLKVKKRRLSLSRATERVWDGKQLHDDSYHSTCSKLNKLLLDQGIQIEVGFHKAEIRSQDAYFTLQVTGNHLNSPS